MGMQINQGSYSGSGSYRTPTTVSEINVTPLVDVMLVLLIVFMVSAPLMQHGIQVEVPKTSAQTLDEQKEPVVLVVHKTRKITINNNEIPKADLVKKLAAIFKTRNLKEIFIQADQSISYGYVAEVMADVRRAGITKLGLVTEPPETTNTR